MPSFETFIDSLAGPGDAENLESSLLPVTYPVRELLIWHAVLRRVQVDIKHTSHSNSLFTRTNTGIMLNPDASCSHTTHRRHNRVQYALRNIS